MIGVVVSSGTLLRIAIVQEEIIRLKISFFGLIQSQPLRLLMFVRTERHTNQSKRLYDDALTWTPKGDSETKW